MHQRSLVVLECMGITGVAELSEYGGRVMGTVKQQDLVTHDNLQKFRGYVLAGSGRARILSGHYSASACIELSSSQYTVHPPAISGLLG